MYYQYVSNLVKTFTNNSKNLYYFHKSLNTLPESIGHLIWPLEVFSYTHACNLCSKPLNGTLCDLHGYSIHTDCYDNLGVTGLGIL